MDAHTFGVLLLGGAGLALVVRVPHKPGRALAAIPETRKPEDFDDAARALASARKVSRAQVRELAPNVVSLDFQCRDLLARGSVDLRRVWAQHRERVLRGARKAAFAGRVRTGTCFSLIGRCRVGNGSPSLGHGPGLPEGMVLAMGGCNCCGSCKGSGCGCCGKC